MSTTTASHEQKKEALHAAVLARLAYWDAMRSLEKLYVGEGDVTDEQSDNLVDHVGTLAANYPGSAETPNPDAIEDGHVTEMDSYFA
ncbi:hypothetical protein WL29_23750 [Burkholderia ubonensis]|uniref:Uncharacterized protein n=1 Tax=Burkholderia ubonensis TaxID=101571 RepID=A0A119HFR3_9BURK|nr:hypothetical protein [Burkholderia ubonensis]KWA84331.1 hypothetical protein WL29_23750 [Burkholderia ubonensis]